MTFSAPKAFFRIRRTLALVLWLPIMFSPLLAVTENWISLFDGQSLAGWRAAENPSSFHVVDGTIACDGPRAHLFYLGKTNEAVFEDFELSAEVMTKPGANSGIFFHSAYQDTGWPTQGFEVQVDNSQQEHAGYLELKMTGSFYGIRNVYKALVRDNEWFTLNILVRKPQVQVRLNGVLVVDYIEPFVPAARAVKFNRLGKGNFALQCHDPESKAFFRNLRVRRVPPSNAQLPRPVLDQAAIQRLELSHANFPLVDLHTHLKGGLTLEQALTRARATGFTLGIATNGGLGFPVQNDSAADEFVQSLHGQPVFIGLQGEGREWVRLFSAKTRARFDYIFTDSMTYTDAAGRRLRLWIPAETEIGADVQAFMDYLTDEAVKIISNEPIDIYANPTYLPEAIASRYNELWTDARIQRIVGAAAKHHVAIEINGHYKLPSEHFLRIAKATGVKFTFGTNNTSPADFGDWSYQLEMQKKLDLTWKDMFVPGHQPSRAQREYVEATPTSP